MMTTPRLNTALGALALAGITTLSACGANGSGSDAIQLPAAAAEGRAIANTNGCGSCHGTNGEGGIGPAFANLFGSTIELNDGSFLTVDREYVIDSIKNPAARRVEGFSLPMPTNRLTDDEIDRIVNYIEALAAPAGETAQ